MGRLIKLFSVIGFMRRQTQLIFVSAFVPSELEDWLSKFMPHPLAILIADDCQKDIKNTLRKSFRQLRNKIRPLNYALGKLVHVHDDMYFGSSKDSIGIQLADLCGYFIANILRVMQLAKGSTTFSKTQLCIQNLNPLSGHIIPIAKGIAPCTLHGWCWNIPAPTVTRTL
jgi:hypothetical protein